MYSHDFTSFFQGILCLLTAGEDKGPGFVMMTGPEELVKDLGPK